MLFDCLSICENFSSAFRFVKTLYIYRRDPPASRGEVRVASRGGRESGALPCLQYAPALFLFPFICSGSRLSARGVDTPARARAVAVVAVARLALHADARLCFLLGVSIEMWQGLTRSLL